MALLTVAADGSLENRGVAAAADSPSYLVRAGELIYAAGEGAGVVSAYRVSGSELHFLGLKDTAGELPCGLAVLGDVHDDVRGDVPGDRSALAVACYGDGSVDVHPLGPGGAIQDTGQSLHGRDRGSVDKDSVGKDSAGKESAVDKGSVGRQPRVEQDGPHAHAVLEVDATTVLTTDLGTDDVYIHSREGAFLTRTGSVRLPTGSGPRDLMLHPSVWSGCSPNSAASSSCSHGARTASRSWARSPFGSRGGRPRLGRRPRRGRPVRVCGPSRVRQRQCPGREPGWADADSRRVRRLGRRLAASPRRRRRAVAGREPAHELGRDLLDRGRRYPGQAELPDGPLADLPVARLICCLIEPLFDLLLLDLLLPD
ncbi:MAG: beta-propeller fold lactonase family protein [Galbitalea sp.]